MRLDGAFLDVELVGDLLVQATVGDEAEDAELLRA